MLKLLIFVCFLITLPSISFAQFRDTLHHADTLKTKIVPPTVSEVVIQSLIGEAVFGGVFFGLKGNEILNGANINPSEEGIPGKDPTFAIYAWAVSAIAITVWGNAFSYGENNCWRPILGGLAGLFFGALPDWISGDRLSATELGKYLVLSQFSIAAAIATYYLWPTEPDSSSSGSSSKILLTPFLSPQLSGIGLSFSFH